MGRVPCCGGEEEAGVKKGPWTPEEDRALLDYIERNGGHGSWRRLPKMAGLNRCGKSCRLRWTNYLRPDIKRGRFSDDEDQLIIHLHSHLGNKWSAIATRLPGRTDNEIKNYWNTHLRKKLLAMGIDPVTHRPRADVPAALLDLIRLQSDAASLANLHVLTQLLGMAAATSVPPLPSPTNVDSLMTLLGAALLPSGGRRGQYDGMVNLPALTSVPVVVEPILDRFGGAVMAGDGLISSMSLEHAACCSCNMTTPMATGAPAVLTTPPEKCNVGEGAGGGPDTVSSSSLVSSPLGGLNDVDELNTDGSWKELLEQMSWLNSP